MGILILRIFIKKTTTATTTTTTTIKATTKELLIKTRLLNQVPKMRKV